MGSWQKTACVLCAQNCGVEALVENNRLVKIRPDKENPRSKGYICRKGLNLPHHQHHAERLTRPLKKVGNGFQPISWEQALDEISERLGEIVGRHGPKSLAYMGGGGQAQHCEAAFGVRLLRGLGSRYHYSPLAQELTGYYWGWGRALGKQYLHTIPDLDNCQVLVAAGWNGMMSHQVPRARVALKAIASDPARTLVVIDPRQSETAKLADIHLAIRPGCDALLTRAMIALVLANNWQDEQYLAEHCDGWERVAPWFKGFEVDAALSVCGLERGPVEEVCRLMCRQNAAFRPDLGVFMSRHSTLTTYLQIILSAATGNICKKGCNVIPGHVMPGGAHSDERDSRTWRTQASGFPAIMGVYPPNALPEEIEHPGPDRLRALLIGQSNPLRSYADSNAYARAFAKLDLVVCLEVAMSETAALAHYVLPSKSGFECHDAAFFGLTWPEIFMQIRRPIIKPEGDTMEPGQVWLEVARRLGLTPPVPESLALAAKGDRLSFGLELMRFFKENPKAMALSPFVLGQTLGKEWNSPHLAALWGILANGPREFQACAARAGFAPGPAMGDQIFQALLDNPQGVVVGLSDPRDNFSAIRHEDGKIHLHAPEAEKWIEKVTPADEPQALAEDLGDWPFVLMAGQHMDENANTLMRDPAWNQGRRTGCLLMNPADATANNLVDGQRVQLSTQADSLEVELRVSPQAALGQVILPHGFGLVFQGKTHGPNVNQLTSAKHRDPFAGTPLHRFVPARVAAA